MILAATGFLLVGTGLYGSWLVQRSFRRGDVVRLLAALLVVIFCAALLAGISVRPAAAAGCDKANPPLTDVQIVQLLKDNGWPADLIETGAAVVLAESGGNPLNCNSIGARGLWQFMPNTLADDGCAYDAACSTKAAKALYDRRQWQPWEAYTGPSGRGSSGPWRNYVGRIQAAMKQAGIQACDPVMNVGCFLGQQPNPIAGLPQQPLSGLPQLPSLDPGRLAQVMVAALIFSIDEGLKGIFDKLWSGMVVGEDDLGGTTRAGQVLIIDNTKLHEIWAFMFELVFSSNVLILLLTMGSLLYMFGGSAGHELARTGLRFLFSLLLMGASWFVLTQIISIDNAYVNTINAHVSMELRNLPAYQGLNLNDPAPLQSDPALLGEAIALEALIFFLGVFMVLLMILLVIRLVVIWLLVSMSPWAAALYPFAPELVGRYFRTLMGWIFLKAAVSTVVMVFMLMGLYSPWAFLNVLIMIAAVIAFIALPAVFLGIVAEPWAVSVGGTAHMAAIHWTQSPIRMAGGAMRSRMRGVPPAQAKLQAQTGLQEARAEVVRAQAERLRLQAEARAAKEAAKNQRAA